MGWRNWVIGCGLGFIVYILANGIRQELGYNAVEWLPLGDPFTWKLIVYIAVAIILIWRPWKKVEEKNLTSD
jgi:hypothetical protein